MARLFDDASSDYLERTSAVVGAYPFTLAGWGKVDELPSGAGTDFTLLAISTNGSNTHRHSLCIASSTNKPYLSSNDGSSKFAEATLAVSLNTWHHLCCVGTSAISRDCYLDGGNKGSNTTSCTPVGMDRTSIGRLNIATPTIYFSGDIAEAAIWNVGLTAAEIISLSKGFSPLLIRPQNLVAYWPLIRGLNDKVGGANLTANGTTVSPHCATIYPK